MHNNMVEDKNTCKVMSIMDAEPKVSIVMPVYNAKEYVGDTIKSVLAQTYEDFELIIIDDGSSDGSEMICEALSSEDSRIRLYHQENHGICYSRNRAMELARGKYIAFCDHDDFYEPIYLQTLVEAAEHNQAELVKGKYKGIIESDGVEVANITMDYLDGECPLDRLLADYRYFLRTINVLWNGLYQRKLIVENQIMFDSSFKAGWEDNLFNLEYLKKCKKIYGVNELIYSHIRRTGQSASLGYNENRADDLLRIYHEEADFLDQYKQSVSGRTFIDHQTRFLNALKTELWYDDCPLNTKEKRAKIKRFIDDRKDFKRVLFADVYSAFRSKPKVTIKWLMFHLKMSSMLCLYWNIVKE